MEFHESLQLHKLRSSPLTILTTELPLRSLIEQQFQACFMLWWSRKTPSSWYGFVKVSHQQKFSLLGKEGKSYFLYGSKYWTLSFIHLTNSNKIPSRHKRWVVNSLSCPQGAQPLWGRGGRQPHKLTLMTQCDKTLTAGHSKDLSSDGKIVMLRN